MKFSVVIPVYNSEKSLEELYARLRSVFKGMGNDFEVIFVNDCSHDRSYEILEKIYRENINIKIVDFFKNYGQQNALLCGFGYCEGDYVVTIDDDLQNPPEEIPKLYEKLAEGYDAVFGCYRDKKDKSYKNFGSYLIRKINHNVFNIKDDLKFSSFRVIRKEVVDQIKNTRTIYPYISGMLMSVTSKVANVYIQHEKRKYGESNYTLGKLISLSYNLIINYSSLPLKAISVLGLAVSCLSFLVGMIFVVKKLLLGQAPAGWTSLIVLMSLFNSIILVILFVFGEYLSRILKEVSGHKQFTVKEVLK
ncbi:glycosyltransferase family 2 protein [Desulfuromonas sp.]|uniref:glycosyltransferase family 2 protein n=1 Tax=Desulfuromonas sp. TaxID=892 RepID=UPI0025C010F0|nr:glycosyltransferase family 2 protein [Desulfuromonas sp.]